MASEIDDLRGHYDRYRAVTLEHLQRLSDEQLLWRPRPDAFNCAQHFVHLAQTEDFYMRGLFGQDWNPERLRLPKPLPNKEDLQGQFETVRKLTSNAFSTLTLEQLTPSCSLERRLNGPFARGYGMCWNTKSTRRSWLSTCGKWGLCRRSLHSCFLEVSGRTSKSERVSAAFDNDGWGSRLRGGSSLSAAKRGMT
jgi:hypothetical protein